MSNRTPFFSDGYWGSGRKIFTSPKEYPFEATGDVTSCQYTKTYRCDPGLWAPATPLAVDPDDGSFKLLGQTRPDAPKDASQATFTRTYGNTFADQVSYDWPKITKPDALTAGQLAGYLFDNAGISTGLSVALYLSYLWTNSKVYGPRQACTAVISGSDTRVTKAGHGIVAGDDIVVETSGTTKYLFLTTQFTVIDANTIDLLGSTAGTTIVYLNKKIRSYTPGPYPVRAKLTQKFTDAPSGVSLPAAKLSDADFLAAVIANTSGYVVYDASGIAFWNGTPRSTYTVTELDFATI